MYLGERDERNRNVKIGLVFGLVFSAAINKHYSRSYGTLLVDLVQQKK